MNDDDDDFLYEVPPRKSREDIHAWILSWLKYDESNIPIMIHNIPYYLHSHFHIAFMWYSIFINAHTHEWIWYKMENFYYKDEHILQSMHFKSFDDLIQYATDEFYHQWNK